MTDAVPSFVEIRVAILVLGTRRHGRNHCMYLVVVPEGIGYVVNFHIIIIGVFAAVIAVRAVSALSGQEGAGVAHEARERQAVEYRAVDRHALGQLRRHHCTT